ncbi:CRISPR-associated protein Cas2 [Nitrosococcus halophilus Nc 4]|uniref:CRISPR-associated endoribonuclease Cas2 n=1 Tax=Nitrosococcus halophilus (strain Nc4) TaxID=472759 RepID=D5BXZ6_NITHN|nr:CRISPR-associated endonuclease Cas2 [Nitrosococcus halophilus]ADE15907.1 CRISPR-associated protein Cas2 [Nitrosococcus halophilus Nc 4]
MASRQLYLAAYDIASATRLRQALYCLKKYATGGQKSVFECYLTKTERRKLLREMEGIIDAEEDRFLLLRLDPRSRVRTLGIAVKPVDPAFFYVG